MVTVSFVLILWLLLWKICFWISEVVVFHSIKATADQAFEEADIDKSGSLSREELFGVFQKVAAAVPGVPPSTQEDANEAFKSLDTDNSGALSKEEFFPFVVVLTLFLIGKALEDANAGAE